LIHFDGATANKENENKTTIKEISLCHDLFWRERADKVHEIPAIGIREPGPFVKLRIGMNV